MKCVKLMSAPKRESIELSRVNWEFIEPRQKQGSINLKIAWSEKRRISRDAIEIQWDENAMYPIWNKK